MSFLELATPFVMAHRGFDVDGLENTMSAFQAALDLGVQHLETDVHATADGKLVAFHDDRLDRVTDLTGRIDQIGWSQVSRARIGGVESVPLLEDVLGNFPQARLNIDVKTAAAVGPLVDVLARTNAYDRVCVASFSDVRRRAVLRRLPRPVASSPGMGSVARFWAGVRAGKLGAGRRREALRDVVCLQVPRQYGRITLVDSRFVAAAHELGTQVHVWTPNDPAEMRELLDLGVDALITDRSDLAVRVVAQG